MGRKENPKCTCLGRDVILKQLKVDEEYQDVKNIFSVVLASVWEIMGDIVFNVKTAELRVE